HYAVLWAGDSRAYLCRDNIMLSLTRDHVAGDVSGHVTRAIGADAVLTIDVVHGTVVPGDRLLLCSDGLTKSLGEGDILSAACTGTVAQAVRPRRSNVMVSGARDEVMVSRRAV